MIEFSTQKQMMHEIWHLMASVEAPLTFLKWPTIIVVAAIAAVHVILHKRDAKVALAWFSVIVLSPVLGTICYFVLGINRIKGKATSFREEHPSGGTASAKSSIERIENATLLPNESTLR